jgi:hypothetical protein
MADMKHRHDIALALVGWYHRGFTDEAEFVGHAELRTIQRRKAGLPDTDDPDNESQCIGTDDPRLKEK